MFFIQCRKIMSSRKRSSTPRFAIKSPSTKHFYCRTQGKSRAYFDAGLSEQVVEPERHSCWRTRFFEQVIRLRRQFFTRLFRTSHSTDETDFATYNRDALFFLSRAQEHHHAMTTLKNQSELRDRLPRKLLPFQKAYLKLRLT